MGGRKPPCGVLARWLPRWVIIEDIDRVPFELLSAVSSLLETNVLVLPGRGDPLPAAPGFCLFGTRTVTGSRLCPVVRGVEGNRTEAGLGALA